MRFAPNFFDQKRANKEHAVFGYRHRDRRARLERKFDCSSGIPLPPVALNTFASRERRGTDRSDRMNRKDPSAVCSSNGRPATAPRLLTCLHLRTEQAQAVALSKPRCVADCRWMDQGDARVVSHAQRRPSRRPHRIEPKSRRDCPDWLIVNGNILALNRPGGY